MSESFPRSKLLTAGLLVAIALGLWQWRQLESPKAPLNGPVAGETDATPDEGSRQQMTEATTEQQRGLAGLKLKTQLQRRLDQKNARVREAVLTFETDEAYRQFLARAGQAGLRLLGQLDRLRTVRVGYDSLDPLFDHLLANPSAYRAVDANYLVNPPGIPALENRPKVSQVPLGNSSLAFLGVSGAHHEWGRGVTVAVLDTGVAADATFSGARVQYLDAGMGLMPGNGPEDGHGTAIAGLVAGDSADAPGVAPAATILSIRITGADGTSDSFTLAKGILAAVDAGARIINISLGSYSPASVLTSVIDYAVAQGAVIVAAAGNDGAAQLQWPAADPRVVSVGAVDALEQQVYFSNAGAQLKVAAPGYGVDAAWLNGQRVRVDGTSASAPFVAGAIAAVMSTSPGLSATQAWSVLQQHTSNGGAPGTDPDYGNGILNVGWAMDRANPLRVDTAIAGQYFDATTNTMNFVVQNRSAQPASGLQLDMDLGGATASRPIPLLKPGDTFLVQTPVDPNQLTTSGGIFYRTQLTNPAGIVDQLPANNAKSGVILAPAK